MPDEYDDEERPELLPDGEVAKYLKRQWARFRAVPASKKVGGLNILFGVLGVIGSSLSITYILSSYALMSEAGPPMGITMYQLDLLTGQDHAKESEAAWNRELAIDLARCVTASGLHALHAAFLAASGVLLLAAASCAKKLARLALLLLPVVFLVECLIYWRFFVCPEWIQLLVRGLEAVGMRVGTLCGIAFLAIGFAWIVGYPLLALRVLKREASEG